MVDGTAVRFADTVAFKGMMLSGVPNMAFAIGYTLSSWTLKVGLLCEHFCRLLAHMETQGFEVCTPVADPAMATQPLLNFGAGYVQRSLGELPRQGSAFPWLMSWSYASDAKLLRKGRSGKQAPAIHAAPHPDCPGCHSAGCGMNAASTCDRAMEALASDGDIKSVDIRQPACRQAGKAGHQADFRQSSSSGSGSARHAKLSRPSELASRVCPGQVISDTSIGRLIADFCSKALGGKLPSVECSRTLLWKPTM